ncbi:MAG: type II toxin-antitoxin system VapC family toxin [Acidobacteriia bacterium]|nr:type II toxin-antitoxin system VapC family toxin [Terriglobia bacterium]
MRSKTELPTLHILDTSALIALVHHEPGWETVQRVLGNSAVCAIHLTEAITKLIRKGGEPRLVERYLRALPMPVLPWNEELAWESRDLAPLAWTHGISLADRACLAMARHLDAIAMTGDAGWANLDLNVRVALFREGKRK